MKGLIVAAGIALGIYIVYRTYYMLNLDGSLEQRLRAGALILDVRTPGEWNGGHIEGAMNIPLSKLHKAPIPIDTDRVIITCCSHGLRSVKAVSLLRARGYRKVYNGGAWSDLERLTTGRRQ